MNLIECLQYLKETENTSTFFLNDGADSWDVDILMDYFDDCDEEEKSDALKDGWYVDDTGIYYSEDEYIPSIPVYSIERKHTLYFIETEGLYEDLDIEAQPDVVDAETFVKLIDEIKYYPLKYERALLECNEISDELMQELDEKYGIN